jgi:CRP/FNR family transcriptional regulator, cyclic AMP receptor protein
MPPMLQIAKLKPFDTELFLRSASEGTASATYRAGEIIFSQGDVSDTVLYLREGAVKLSVLSRSGKEAVVAIVEAGAFFGEGAVASRPVRHEVATAMTAAAVLIIPKPLMIRLLHEQHEFSDRFIAHMLARNIRIEQDVVDQLFNSGAKRLARALLLLAHYGTPVKTHRVPLRISQQTLADMVGTTRSRVNFFMNRFKKLGYIEYRDGLKVNDSLATVLLRDQRARPRRSKAG